MHGPQYHLDISRTTNVLVLPLENAGNHPFQEVSAENAALGQIVEHQVGRVVRFRVSRGFVGGVDDWTSPIGLVELQARLVLFENVRVTTQFRVVRQAFKEHTNCTESQGLTSNPDIERPAHTASCQLPVAGEVVKIAEIQIRIVIKHCQTADGGAMVFGHIENRTKTVFKRKSQ